MNPEAQGTVSEVFEMEQKADQQKRLSCFQDMDSGGCDDMFVDLTIYDVPVSLLREFGENIVRSHYPSGVNEAIKDLLRKAILEEQQDQNSPNALTTQR